MYFKKIAGGTSDPGGGDTGTSDPGNTHSGGGGGDPRSGWAGWDGWGGFSSDDFLEALARLADWLSPSGAGGDGEWEPDYHGDWV